MLALVVMRLTLAAAQLRRSLTEAAAVRDASAELVAAADVPSIEAAVSSALRRLLRAGTAVSVRLVAEGVGPETSEPPQLTAPLHITDPIGRTTVAGTLLVRVPPSTLPVVRRPLEVISAQASLALARVRLTEEVIEHRSDEYFRALVQNATDVILIVDDDVRIRFASPSAQNMFQSSTVAGKRFPDLLAPVDRRRAEKVFEDTYRHGDVPSPHAKDNGVTGSEWLLGGPGARKVEMSCLDLRHDDAIRGLVVTLRDVTERRQFEARLLDQTLHDPLTGLGNRSLFTARVEQAVADAEGTDSFPGVLFIDLDDFKVVNDGYGHVIGDAFLREAGERIRTAVSPSGLVARVGGDEFAVLVQRTSAPSAVDSVAERLVNTLAQKITVHGHVLTCSASVGVATTADARGSLDLLRHGHLALYEAKRSGKRQWRHYDDTMTSVIMQRLAVRTALAESLHTDALRMQYQPIVALENRQTVGFEALLRWEHPSRGTLGPSEFIDVAEDSGLIGPIGDWVLGASVHEAAQWEIAAPDAPPYVSVNVSAKQFRSREIFDSVRRHLDDSGLPPGCLMLEITESLLLQDDDDVMEELRRLRRLGIRIAIDDFGTGYSALSYLQRVPLDVVKLDRLFTRMMASSAQQRELVAGIVQLTRTLGLDVIAEGIETEEEYALVREVGCRYGQGYLFARPMEAGTALDWVADPARALAGRMANTSSPSTQMG